MCVDTRLAEITQDSSKLVLVLCQCPSAKVCFARLHLRDRHILPVTTADLCGNTVVPALRSQSVLLSCVRHNQKTTWHLHPMHKVQHKWQEWNQAMDQSIPTPKLVPPIHTGRRPGLTQEIHICVPPRNQYLYQTESIHPIPWSFSLRSYTKIASP